MSSLGLAVEGDMVLFLSDSMSELWEFNETESAYEKAGELTDMPLTQARCLFEKGFIAIGDKRGQLYLTPHSFLIAYPLLSLTLVLTSPFNCILTLPLSLRFLFPFPFASSLPFQGLSCIGHNRLERSSKPQSAVALAPFQDRPLAPLPQARSSVISSHYPACLCISDFIFRAFLNQSNRSMRSSFKRPSTVNTSSSLKCLKSPTLSLTSQVLRI